VDGADARIPIYCEPSVGSHLGVRIWNLDPKRPSNVRISTNYILTLDGSARGLNFKRRRLVCVFESLSPPAESTKRLKREILKLDGFCKCNYQIKWIFSVRRGKAQFPSGCKPRPAISLRPVATGVVVKVTTRRKPLVERAMKVAWRLSRP
jgi:hypothetical protein